jgi:hypothetical protein
MEFLFEAIFQFVGEILLQAIVQLLVELGLHSLGETLKRPKHPVLSIIGFTLWGLIAGGISLLVFPTSAIPDPTLRMANLFITPLLVGAMMALVGKVRLQRGQDLVRIDRFGYAFTFAFWMAFVRFVWAA